MTERDGRLYDSVRRDYEPHELVDLNATLVRSVGEVRQLREQRTQTLGEMNTLIKAAEKVVWDTQLSIARGYEVLEVEVVIMMDTPRPGTKSIFKIDDPKTPLREEPMSSREKHAQNQDTFNFPEDDRPDPAAGSPPE